MDIEGDYTFESLIEETVVGQELIQIGKKEGLNKGELIGEIRATQKFLNHPVTDF